MASWLLESVWNQFHMKMGFQNHNVPLIYWTKITSNDVHPVVKSIHRKTADNFAPEGAMNFIQISCYSML